MSSTITFGASATPGVAPKGTATGSVAVADMSPNLTQSLLGLCSLGLGGVIALGVGETEAALEANLDGVLESGWGSSTALSICPSISVIAPLAAVLLFQDVLLPHVPVAVEGEGSTTAATNAVSTWEGVVTAGASAGISGPARRSPSLEDSRVFSLSVVTFGVAGFVKSTFGDAALAEADWEGLLGSIRGDADGEADLAAPQTSVRASPSLLVVLVVLECAGRLRSAKPLAVRSLSLPLSFAVIGSNS